MRNIFKYLGLATMAMALLSLTACKDDDQKQDNPSSGSKVYKLHYTTTDSPALADGDTVDYSPERWEYEEQPAMTHATFYIENCTDGPIMTTQTYDFVEGQMGQILEICAGGGCPWNGQPYEVAKGIDANNPIVVEMGLDQSYTGTSIAKLTVGRAETMADAVTVYVRVKFN